MCAKRASGQLDIVTDLTAEHRLIEGVLDVLEDLARRTVDTSAAAPPGSLEAIVAFLREFVDGVHHEKEELILFPAMEQGRAGSDDLPIACLLRDHELGRKLAGWMSELVRRRERWNQVDREWFAERAVSYSALLRWHIDKEDTVLFPFVGARLTPAGRRQILRDYDPLRAKEQSRPWVAAAGELSRLRHRPPGRPDIARPSRGRTRARGPSA